MSPPNTRKRKQSSGSADAPKASKISKSIDDESSRYYFEDGNIILVADKTAFRVHKGLLAHNSEVFRDMFDVVQQPKGSEVFDGVPVVQLSDSKEDLTCLLEALYGFPRTGSPNCFPTWGAILRLATKYLLTRLQLYAIDTFTREFPTTLEEFDVHSEWGGEMRELAITLARETGQHRLLPSALYLECVYGFSSDSTPLTTLDKLTYYEGKDKLTRIWTKFVRDEWSGKSTCSDPECAKDWNELAQMEQRRVLSSNFYLAPDPLAELMIFCDLLGTRDKLCRIHSISARNRAERKREEIWQSLPGLFGLGTWEVLKKDL